MAFAERLNRLFDSVYPPGRGPYSSAEAVAGVRAAGTPMSAPYLSQLRSGKRDNPSLVTVAALAKFFGVEATYFTDDEYAAQLDRELEALANVRESRPRTLASAQKVSNNHTEDTHRVASVEHTSEWSTPPDLNMPTFADRLNRLFDTSLNPDGIPYSSTEVASALQSDSLPVSSGLLARLRSGTGDPPSRATLEAICYFFGVSIDSFTEGSRTDESHGLAVPHRSRVEQHSMLRSSGEACKTAHIALTEAGSCISALSNSSIQWLDEHPPKPLRARQLMALASKLGTMIAQSNGESVNIPSGFRDELRRGWTWADAGKHLDPRLYERLTGFD